MMLKVRLFMSDGNINMFKLKRPPMLVKERVNHSLLDYSGTNFLNARYYIVVPE
jgi:hypothetical protein